MNTPLITMDEDKALAKLEAYKKTRAKLAGKKVAVEIAKELERAVMKSILR